jgi:hypothetical protein
MTKFSEHWDKVVKPVAEEVFKKCTIDPLVQHYVGQMIFYIEHDLADDRSPQIRLYPCVGTLNSEEYYFKIHKESSKEEVELLRKLGILLNELQDK